MSSFEERVNTYLALNWIYKEGSCAPSNMAKAGFICTAGTAAQCYYCEKELDGWEETDDPWHEHKKHAGFCPFVKKYESAPDPKKFTLVEAVQLEKERLLLKVNTKYEKTIENIEDTFKSVEKNLAGKNTRRKRN